ncbi:MAG: endonuclease III [Anaerolineae bacterium]
MIYSVDEERLASVLDILEDGRSLSPSDDPVSELVGTILAQHTRDSDPVYQSLRRRFPAWEMVRVAPEEAIVEAIRSGGLARVKARRIKLALSAIAEERGGLELGFLGELATDQARRWLSAIPGVGPKTAACVLLFGLGRPVLPVDDHVHRCVTRLGLVAPDLSAAASHAQLERALGEDAHETFVLHTGLHRLSREVCRAHGPKCSECPLAVACAFA